MRALAEFVMRGRLQAIAVSVGLALLPLGHWFSAAIVCLVLLRKGVSEGLVLLLLASTPLIGLYITTGDPGPLMGLMGMVCLASILRSTQSWELVLGAVVVVAGASSLIFEVLVADDLTRLVEWYLELTADGSAQLIDPVEMQELTRQVVMGLFAMGQAYAMIGFLVLARSWQSQLYHPGGFQAEFHQLRIPAPLAAGIVALLLVCVVIGTPQALRWIPLLTVPLVMAAIGLVHWLVAMKGLSGHWLGGFYIVLIIMYQLVSPLLASLALMDSWFELRKKFRSDREV